MKYIIIAIGLALAAITGAWFGGPPSDPTLGVVPNIFRPAQGGTGIGSATAGQVGKVIKVLSNSPFTYELADDNTSAGGAAAFEIATTTDIALSQLAYINKTTGRTTLASVATTTVTATSPLSLSNPIAKVGGSNSVISLATTTNSLFSGTAGQVLGFINGGWFGVATTTFNSPLSFSGGAVSLDTSGTWTGTAALATALGANGANCSAGNFPLGVDASGAVETCTDAWTESENTTAAYAAQATTLTVAGTANQLTSSAGAQSLAANRTWTLSLPNHVVFPSSFQVTSATATNATSTNMDITSKLTFNGITGTTWAAFCTTITGGAGLCDGDDATGAGGSSAFEIATTTDIAVSELAYLTKTIGRTTLGSVATGTISSANSALTVTGGRSAVGGAALFTISTTTTNMFTGTPGQVLGYTNLGWTGVATTTFSTGLTYSGGAVTVNTSQNIATLSNLTSNGLVTTSGSNGTLGVTANSTGGLVLAMSGGIPTWVATTTFSSGLAYSGGNVTNTGVTSIVAGTGITISGATGAVTINALSSSKWATSTDAFAIYPNGLTNPVVGIGTTTPKFTLQVASSTRSQLALSDGSLTGDQLTIRTSNGNYYFATSSAATSATSTVPIMSFDTNGTLTLGKPLPATSGGTSFGTYTTGDTLYSSATNVLSKLAIGSAGQIKAVSGGIPAWIANTTLTSTLFTSPNASTTAVTIGNFLTVPNLAALTTAFAGAIGIDTTSGQLRWTADGSTSFSAVRDWEPSLTMASTTLDNTLIGFNTATSTLFIANRLRPVTATNLYCKTTNGTMIVEIGSGSATATPAIVCTPTGTNSTLSANNTFATRANIVIGAGSATTTTKANGVTITLTARETQD